MVVPRGMQAERRCPPLLSSHDLSRSLSTRKALVKLEPVVSSGHLSMRKTSLPPFRIEMEFGIPRQIVANQSLIRESAV